jgi:hypothetical protein
MRFNPVSGSISLVVGWFLMAFLQAAVRCAFAGDLAGLGRRFTDIGLFRSPGGVVVNIVAIVVVGAIGTALWFMRRH